MSINLRWQKFQISSDPKIGAIGPHVRGIENNLAGKLPLESQRVLLNFADLAGALIKRLAIAR